MANQALGTAWIPGAGATWEEMLAGAAITLNDVVYRDTTVSPATAKQAIATSQAAAACAGFATHAAAAGEYVRVATGGEWTLSGATLTVAVPLFVSGANAGKVAPLADLGSGKYPTKVCWCKTATLIKITLDPSTVAVP